MAMTSAVSTTCRLPMPKIGLRISHSLSGCSSRPTRNSIISDAELGEVHDVPWPRPDQPEDARPDDDAGRGIAEHGAQAEACKQRRREDRGGKIDERAGQQLFKMHRRSWPAPRRKAKGRISAAGRSAACCESRRSSTRRFRGAAPSTSACADRCRRRGRCCRSGRRRSRHRARRNATRRP